jgi:cell division transport system permease protein
MLKASKKLGAFPNILVVLSLTIALFLIGVCGWLTINARNLTSYIREQFQVHVFLEKGLSQTRIDSIFREIKAKPFVLTNQGSPQVNFVSKDVFEKNFLAQYKDENYQKLLGENPTRDAYAIRVSEAYFNEVSLRKIALELQEIKGVHEADYTRNFVDEINANVQKVYLFLAGAFLLLLILILILINNTIRLALYSQRFLIRSMQLVGATHGFIRRPFLTRGALQGLMSGMLAGIFLLVFQQIVIQQIPELQMLQDLTKFLFLIGGILLLGVLIGLTSTLRSVERYLNVVSIDELYQ